MPSPSLLEKAVVLKGFGRDSLVTVQGDLRRGSVLRWYNLAAHFLVDRFCRSDRYDAVLCFHADDSSAYGSSISGESGVKQARFVSLSNPHFTFQQLVDVIDNNLAQAVAEAGTHDGKAVIAVVLFGFSDLLLRIGLAKSLELLEAVRRSTGGPLSKRDAVTKCIVLAVNSALHRPATVERLIEMSDTIVTTTNCNYIDTSSSSNNSSGNFAEVYTMRKTGSGKINEDLELFGYDASHAVRCMYPLLDGKTTANAAQPAEDSSCDKSGCTDHSHTHKQDPSRSGKELLVTFDSNDPEFEGMDEDPDDDLDL